MARATKITTQKQLIGTAGIKSACCAQYRQDFKFLEYGLKSSQPHSKSHRVLLTAFPPQDHSGQAKLLPKSLASVPMHLPVESTGHWNMKTVDSVPQLPLPSSY
jgi:hypothetical protein